MQNEWKGPGESNIQYLGIIFDQQLYKARKYKAGRFSYVLCSLLCCKFSPTYVKSFLFNWQIHTMAFTIHNGM